MVDTSFHKFNIKPEVGYILVEASFNFFMVIFGVIYPLYALSIGLSNFQMNILDALFFQLAVLILEVPTGVVADVYGKRNSAMLGYLLFGIGVIIFSIPAFWTFALGEFIAAIGYTLTSGAITSWVIEKVGEKRSQKVLSRGGFWSNIFGIVAGIISGILVFYTNNFSLVALVSGVGMFVVGIIGFFILQKDTTKLEHKKRGLEKILDSGSSSCPGCVFYTMS